MLKLPDGTIKALIEAQDKAKILKYIKKDDNYYLVNAELINKQNYKKSSKTDALVRRLQTRFGTYAKLNRNCSIRSL